MNTKHTRPHRKVPARGHPRKDGTIEAGIRFEADLFEEMRALAVKRRTTLSEIVRTFCQWGLDVENKEAMS